MKNKILNNWGLKLASLLFAFMLWLIVINITDPQKEQPFKNIPVKLINAEVLTDEGLVYEVLDETDVIDTVTVYAPRTIIEELEAGDLVAEADIKDLTVANTVPIKIRSNRYNDKITNIKSSIDNVRLNIEEEKTVRLVLKTSTVGTVADGYLVGNSTADQNLLIVSGPESIVSRITRAAAEVDVTGSTSNIATYAEVKLYDEEGEEIKEKSLKKNFSTVRVSVEILATKEVPLSFNIMGEPAPGYIVSGEITSNVETVLISGSTNLLNGIDSIEIPAEALNVTDQNSDLVVYLDIQEYLPAYTALADSEFSGRVTITVPIAKTVSREFEVDGSKIRILNLPEGFSAGVREEEDIMEVTVVGLPTELDEIRDVELIGTIDIEKLLAEGSLEEVKAGVYNVPLSLYLPENVTIKVPLQVHLIISDLEEE